MTIEISVIIACKDEEKDIPHCLEAISQQSYPQENYEVIFVDGNSMDGTVRLISEFSERQTNVSLHNETGSYRSAANARNQGATLSKGELLVFFDADVVIDKDYLSNIASDFKTHHFRAASSHTLSFPSNSYWAHLREHENMASNYVVKNGAGIQFPNIFEKELFSNIGGYDSEIRYGEDLRLLDKLLDLKIKPVNLKNAIASHKDPDTLGGIGAQARFWGSGFLDLFLTDPIRHFPRLMLVIARVLWFPFLLIYLAIPSIFILFIAAIFGLATFVDFLFVFYRSIGMGGKVKYAALLIPFRMIRSFFFIRGFFAAMFERKWENRC